MMRTSSTNCPYAMPPDPCPVHAVLWDMGGVLTTSPFEAFARYERDRGLPEGFLRTINATNPDHNAWACLERGELDAVLFDAAFADESQAAGHRVPGADVLSLLAGDPRPEMLRAVAACRTRATTALLTNNMAPLDRDAPETAAVLALFDVVCQSSEMGSRKPEPEFYRVACERAAVDPSDAVFLDDLGVNLKPARAMGMRTIKVETPARALDELATITGWPVAATDMAQGAPTDG